MNTVNAIAGSATLFPNPQGGRGLQRSAAQQLDQALQAGDLDSARKAFATLQQNAPPPPRGGAAPAASGQDPFSALAKALESGDLGSAQQAFSQIQKAGQGRRTPPPPPPSGAPAAGTARTGSLDLLA